MEDIPRKLEKNLIPPGPAGQDKNKRDWQILFIDDRGRVVPIRQLKILVGVVISLLMISMISAVTFFFLYLNNSGSSYSTKKEIAQYEKRIKSLQNEVDILTAKMVLSESLNKTEPEKKETRQKDNGDSQRHVSEKKEKIVSPKKQAQKEAPEKQPPSTPPDERLPEMEAKDFAFTYITYKNILRIRFTIRNADRKISKVSGYIFLILKENDKKSNTWLTIPAADIVAGKPAQTGRGQYFKISNYKTVHFKLNDIKNPQRFPKAELFVFDRNGKVILQHAEPVVIKTIEGVKFLVPFVEASDKEEQKNTDNNTPEDKEPTTENQETATVQDNSDSDTAETVQDTPEVNVPEPEEAPAQEE